MHYLFESVFVGIYCLFIYYLLNKTTNNFLLLLFLTGFIKHSLGHFIGLHNYYCNYGHKCYNNYKKKDNTTIIKLTCESLLEGIIFISVGLLLTHFIDNKIYIIFIISIILHLLAELFFIHEYFCKNRCIIID